jgi:hypothetical protein
LAVADLERGLSFYRSLGLESKDPSQFNSQIPED